MAHNPEVGAGYIWVALGRKYGREVSPPKRLIIGRSVLAPVTICS